MTPSEKKNFDEIKRRLKEFDRDFEMLERNTIFLSALVSLVASHSGVTRKEFERLVVEASNATGKSHEAIKFIRIMKGFKGKK